jgi:hypothetical protein
MPVPNTETGLVPNSVDVILFEIKFELTVFEIKLVAILKFWC